MPRPIPYPLVPRAREFALTVANPARTRRLLRRFHHWLDQRGLQVESVTADDLDRFVVHRGFSFAAQANYRQVLERYLWPVHAVPILRPSASPLTPEAEAFSQTRSEPETVRSLLSRFQGWLGDRDSGQSTEGDIDRFLDKLWDREPLLSTRRNRRYLLIDYLRWLRLPSCARQFLAEVPEPPRRVVHRLHEWLATARLDLPTLTAAHASAFLRTAKQPKNQLDRYGDWLYAHGHISFQPSQPPPLPLCARQFLEEVPEPPRRLVQRFHDWIATARLELSTLTAAHVAIFLRGSKDRNRRPRLQLRRYLDWLHAHGHVDFQLAPLPPVAPRTRRKLTPAIRPFIAEIALTRKASSTQHYITVVRAFRRWCADHQLKNLKKLRREHLVAWFTTLQERKLAASTRLQVTVTTRTYLRWLYGRGGLHADPDDLVRRSDFPKLPRYLPRPLPPLVDHEIQRRLTEQADLYSLALLVQRRCGLRIGELIKLDLQCLRFDLNDRAFLKVPLGKLDSERLVPLDAATLDIVRRLQAIGPSGRARLLDDSLSESVRQNRLQDTLRRVSCDLDIPDPVTTHRLRHTFATELLSAGMNLLSIMKLLGHRSVRMTLRYADITDDTVNGEFFTALAQIEARYQLRRQSFSASGGTDFDALKAVDDLACWIHARAGSAGTGDGVRVLRALAKRIDRLRSDVQKVTPPRPGESP